MANRKLKADEMIVTPGRPNLLDGGPSLERIWLVPLTKTKAGNEKPKIEIRAIRRSDGWRGYPVIQKALDMRKRLTPMHWSLEEWREATTDEIAALAKSAPSKSVPSKAERETAALIDVLAPFADAAQ